MKALIIVVVIILIIALPMLFFMFYGMGEIKKLIINEVDLSKVSDGIYNGSYHKGRWNFDVQVTLKDHKIVSIKNTNKKMAMFQEFNDKIESIIIEKQSIKIDTVSGATIFTKSYEKAAENALTKALKP